VGDREVVEQLLLELIKPEYSAGVIVDGFPRTMLQAKCIKLLHDRMLQLRIKYRDRPDLRDAFRRPLFHIAVLYVEEEESVRRQLHRGVELEKLNRIAAATGVGPVM
jgi:adenylate kinase